MLLVPSKSLFENAGELGRARFGVPPSGGLDVRPPEGGTQTGVFKQTLSTNTRSRMRNYVSLVAGFVLLLCVNAHSQLSLLAGAAASGIGAPQAPRFGGALSKLFGDNKAFTARMDMEIREPGGAQPITMPGKMSFLDGKTRFEMDVTEAKGTQIPAAAAPQLKAFGLGEVTMISRPDKKVAYMIYPGLQSYLENPLTDDAAAGPDAKYDVTTAELGKETVNGNGCVKNRVIVTDEKGTKHEAIVWNAAGLKNFPVKIQYAEDGRNATLIFSDIKFDKPDAGIFDAPAGFARHESMAGFLGGVMLKQFSGRDATEKKQK